MFKSIFLDIANRCLEGRTSMLSLLAVFPTAGFLLTTTSTIIGMSIINYQIKKGSII
ncbi:MAG: hypothetical protein P4K92_07555 [Candidatus Nitrosotalea sp.]|nr:hypothetical protein [Candidatus Nitrosotalea sp.]